ncbi:MAG TPA: cation diffusion facilitator family transporter [Caulobacteraceae bacterium]|nr:cation diffusion facilitator family transporter [Caulobacteraceae bacterium]
MSLASAPPLGLAETGALTRRITTLSVGVALVLTLAKALVWRASGSVAILASLADSGLDVLAALTTYFAVRYAASPPDPEHRFGHGKAEAFASLTQAGLVFATAALVAEEAVVRLIHPRAVAAEGWGLGVMALSLVLTGALVFAQTRVLARTRSVAVRGDRMHYAADFGSNLVAMAGIGLSALSHVPAFDAVAGLVVAGWLVWGAVGVFRASSLELMDHELGDEQRAHIVELMTDDPRVRDVHNLRTRASGPYIHIQMHAELDPALSLVEAHQVMVAAERRVLAAYPTADIIVHPDPRGAAEPHGGSFPEVHDSAAGPDSVNGTLRRSR